MPSYRPVWVNRELGNKIEAFIREDLGVNPNLGSLFSDVSRIAILFALSKPKEFKEFLDRQG